MGEERRDDGAVRNPASVPFEGCTPLLGGGGVGVARRVGTATEFAYAWPALSGDGRPTGCWRVLTGAYDPVDPDSGDLYVDAEAVHSLPGCRDRVPSRDVLTPLVAGRQMETRFNVPTSHRDRSAALGAIDSFAAAADSRRGVEPSTALDGIRGELERAMEAADAPWQRIMGFRKPLADRVAALGPNASPADKERLLGDWGTEIDVALAGLYDRYVGDVCGEPPCFGDVVRISEGRYVSWARFETVLPDAAERDAWYLYSNLEAGEWASVVDSIGDPGALAARAEATASSEDAICYATTLMPDELEPEELAEARASRPELFDGDGAPRIDDGYAPSPAPEAPRAPARKKGRAPHA